MKMIIKMLGDLNAADSQGNTILHVTMTDMFSEVDALQYLIGSRTIPLQQRLDTVINIIQLLMENGSYLHARNKKGKCPIDELKALEFQRVKPRDLITQITDLLKLYDHSLTLKYMAACVIVDYNIPYKHKLLPESLIHFVNLHDLP